METRPDGARGDQERLASEFAHLNDALRGERLPAWARDRIADFSRGEDKIDLQNIDVSPDVPLTWMGSGGFTGPNQARWPIINGVTVVPVNLDATIAPEFGVAVFGASSFSASDFIL